MSMASKRIKQSPVQPNVKRYMCMRCGKRMAYLDNRGRCPYCGSPDVRTLKY